MADPNCTETLLISLRTTADLTRNNDDAFSQVLYQLNAVLNSRARSETSDSEMYESAVDELLECIKINEPRMREDSKNIALLNFAKSFSAFDHNLLDSLSSNSSNTSEQESMEDSDDEMEGIEQNQCQTSFTDMHDIAIMQVMKKLDIRSLLAMRLVNKRMDKLHSQIKYLKKVKLTVALTGFELKVSPSDGPIYTIRFGKIEELENKLKLLTCDTVVDKLCVRSNFGIISLPLPLLLLTIAENSRKVEIGPDVTISDNNLCYLRETMLEGDCKLEYLHAQPEISGLSFLEECFGVEVDRDHSDEGRNSYDTLIYRKWDESVKLYNERDDDCFYSGVHHFEKDLHTEVTMYVEIKKCEIDEKTKMKKYQRINKNHIYRYYTGFARG